MKKSLGFTLGAIVLVAGGAGAWLCVRHGDTNTPFRPANTPDSAAASPAAGAGAPTGSATTPVASADAAGAGPAAAGTAAAAAAPPVDQIGRVQPVRADANPSVALVAEAARSGAHPERLSAMVPATPFDAVAFAAASPQERERYLTDVQPGRAFQTAQPGPDVPVLAPFGPTVMSMPQDGQVYLRARGAPGYPVSFTSMDLGHFGNQLAAQTVLADANGVASVAFSAGTGTIDAVHIVAASPVTTGQVAFVVTVTPVTAAARP